MRKFRFLAGTMAALFAACTLMQCSSPATSVDSEVVNIDVNVKDVFFENLTFQTPVNFKNLQIFMISGKTAAESINYVPLKEAMEKKLVEIVETSDVNELEISNNSDETVFIHAGDIVKGGKQDRTLTYDLVIAARAKNEKLAGFCVEHGRWEQRGEENAMAFTSNDKMLTSRNLKIASKQLNDQSSVWEEVSNQQERLSSNVSYNFGIAVNVASEKSSSSLELILDNKELNEMKAAYKEHFSNLIDENTIGFAYAINGELYNIDIYNNRQLFLDLFDKLLDAAIIEAITDLKTSQKEFTYISTQKVVEAIKMAPKATEADKSLNIRTLWKSVEDAGKVIFTSIDKKDASNWLHRNLIVKSAEMKKPRRSEESPVNNQFRLSH